MCWKVQTTISVRSSIVTYSTARPRQASTISSKQWKQNFLKWRLKMRSSFKLTKTLWWTTDNVQNSFESNGRTAIGLQEVVRSWSDIPHPRHQQSRISKISSSTADWSMSNSHHHLPEVPESSSSDGRITIQSARTTNYIALTRSLQQPLLIPASGPTCNERSTPSNNKTISSNETCTFHADSSWNNIVVNSIKVDSFYPAFWPPAWVPSGIAGPDKAGCPDGTPRKCSFPGNVGLGLSAQLRLSFGC